MADQTADRDWTFRWVYFGRGSSSPLADEPVNHFALGGAYHDVAARALLLENANTRLGTSRLIARVGPLTERAAHLDTRWHGRGMQKMPLGGYRLDALLLAGGQEDEREAAFRFAGRARLDGAWADLIFDLVKQDRKERPLAVAVGVDEDVVPVLADWQALAQCVAGTYFRTRPQLPEDQESE